MLQGALAAAARQGANPYQLVRHPVQNPEDHFDFTLFTERGPEYLDLMEAAPLERYGGAYDKVPQVFNVGELASAVYELIMRKHSKYQGIWARPIHLLVYNTDWRLSLAPSVTTLLAHWLRTKAHGFASVCYYMPAGVLYPYWFAVYPSNDPELTNFDEAAASRRMVAVFDTSTIKKTPDGQTTWGEVRINTTNFKKARMSSTGHVEFMTNEELNAE